VQAQENPDKQTGGPHLKVQREMRTYTSDECPAMTMPAAMIAAGTPAELDIVRLLSEGLSNKEIAARLFISPRTAQTHLTHIYSKLNLSYEARGEVRGFRSRRGSAEDKHRADDRLDHESGHILFRRRSVNERRQCTGRERAQPGRSEY
jgi:DNA-binding CsgD family transcriptional regulator